MNFYLLKSTREIAERDVVLNRDHISIMIAAKVTSKFNDFYALKIFMTDGQNVPAEFNKEEEMRSVIHDIFGASIAQGIDLIIEDHINCKEEEQCSIELKRPEKTIN